MSPERGADRLSFDDLITWVILAVAAGMLFVGALFILAPRGGAALFGIPAPEGVGKAYVRAIGFRDLALSCYIAALVAFASRRVVAILLGLTTVIPACDVILVAAVSGASWHLALHAATGACFAALALLCLLPRAPSR